MNIIQRIKILSIRSTSTFFLIITSMLLTLNTVKAASSGPEFVKDALTSDGVFNTPSYSFTTEYDDYHEYDNIQGLFIDGLDYQGNPTKFFSWYGVPDNLNAGEKPLLLC